METVSRSIAAEDDGAVSEAQRVPGRGRRGGRACGTAMVADPGPAQQRCWEEVHASRHRCIGTASAVDRDELALYAVPDDRWARREKPLDAHELISRALTWRERGSGTRHVLEEALARAGLTAVSSAVELTTTPAIRPAVAAGSPPAFMSRRAMTNDVETGRLLETTPAALRVATSLVSCTVGDDASVHVVSVR